jgi:hypothetical protein
LEGGGGGSIPLAASAILLSTSCHC